MTSHEFDAPSVAQPRLAEPAWVTTVLRFFPAPIYAFAGSLIAATAALICLIWATSEPSAISWGCFAGIVSLWAWIVAASIARFLHRRRNNVADTRYASSERRSTGTILVLLIWIYSIMLTIGLHVFRNFFAANAPGGIKYNVTLGVAIASSIYMAVHGRRFLRERAGTTGGRNVVLTGSQALVVAVVVVGLGMYLAWLMI